ncbi:MAG: hypothetical protein LBL95_05965 [Deltaproteobacteria bacterium]|jgi:hypothetical protein|nr:hypothetical protein [Deltaproteobacteria bacterium]
MPLAYPWTHHPRQPFDGHFSSGEISARQAGKKTGRKGLPLAMGTGGQASWGAIFHDNTVQGLYDEEIIFLSLAALILPAVLALPARATSAEELGEKSLAITRSDGPYILQIAWPQAFGMLEYLGTDLISAAMMVADMSCRPA